jgi:sulfur relay (sulfurtransferase) complex TusBCD TusD component (DsrE family)
MTDHNGELPQCSTCVEARGLSDTERVGGAQCSMATLAERTPASDRVLTS